jgi:hypothetical protein
MKTIGRGVARIRRSTNYRCARVVVNDTTKRPAALDGDAMVGHKTESILHGPGEHWEAAAKLGVWVVEQKAGLASSSEPARCSGPTASRDRQAARHLPGPPDRGSSTLTRSQC